MNNLDLSVLIPVYNTENYFKKCIESVISAINKANINAEIIVVDDGSKGNIKEIIVEYTEKYSSLIKFFSQENKGRGATRNRCISEAKGKYVHFVDSDDYIEENIYKKVFNNILKNNDDIDMIIFDIKNIDLINYKNEFIIETKNNSYNDNKWGCLDMMISPSCWNKIIKKELIENIKFPENINYEDLAVIPCVILNSKNIFYLNEVGYNYVQNLNSIMNQEFNSNTLNIITALEYVFDKIDILSLTNREKEKAKYILYTRRFYEELLEKISLNNKSKEFIIKFCKNINKLENEMYENFYFQKLLKSQSMIKRLSNRLLHNSIKNNRYNLIEIILKKYIYYRFFAIRYVSIV